MARHVRAKAAALLSIALIAILANSCATPDRAPLDSPLLKFGQDRFLAGEFNDAALAFSDLIIITSSPELQNEALYWRALSYIKLTRFHEAEGDMLILIDRTRDPDLMANALRVLGDALLAQGKFPQASEVLSKALARYPNQIPRDEALYKLAITHLRQGNHYQALPYLQDVAANFPNSVFAERAHDAIAHAAASMSVQFGVFRDRTAADVFAQNLRNIGIDARIESITREQKPLFAVRAGAYRDWDEAAGAVAGFHAQNLDAIVFP